MVEIDYEGLCKLLRRPDMTTKWVYFSESARADLTKDMGYQPNDAEMQNV